MESLKDGKTYGRNVLQEKEPDFVYFRCPTRGCGGIFHEQHRRYYDRPFDRVACSSCSGKGIPVYFSQVGQVSDELSILFVCESCHEEFERSVLASRVRCDKCKQFRNVFWAILTQFSF